MADRARLLALTDDGLGDALRDLGATIDVPAITAANGADLARRARIRLEAAARVQPTGLLDRLRPGRRRTWRRSLVLAVAALLVLAAIAGAIGFGLPGLRIVFGPTPSATAGISPAPSSGALSPQTSAPPRPSPSPTPSGPPGSGLHFGVPVTLADARAAAGFPILLPDDPATGPPDAVWIDDLGRVSLVWRAGPGLPESEESGLGLVVSELPGSIDPGYFEKILGAGTTIEPITVRGRPGYWISGEPHGFVYVDPSNGPRFDDRRLVGDTLAWSDGAVTYRVESALGRDAALRLAETLKPAP